MGKLLCETNLRDVWCRNEIVRAEIGQIVHTRVSYSSIDIIILCSMMPGQKKPMMNLLCLQLLQCRYQGPIVIIMGNGNMRTVSTMPCLSSSSCHLQIQVACDVYIVLRISDLY